MEEAIQAAGESTGLSPAECRTTIRSAMDWILAHAAQFGIAVHMIDGRSYAAGDAATAFSIQSISKVFTLTMALEKLGADLWKRVGREPSGSRFNSMVRLEQEHGIPRNPLINAGALRARVP